MTAKDRLMTGIEERVPLKQLSRLYAEYVLATFGGNKSHASGRLGIDRRTIQRWSRGAPKPRESTRQLSVPGIS